MPQSGSAAVAAGLLALCGALGVQGRYLGLVFTDLTAYESQDGNVYVYTSSDVPQPYVTQLVQEVSPFGADGFYYDRSWRSWLDQQLDLLDSLHTLIAAPHCMRQRMEMLSRDAAFRLAVADARVNQLTDDLHDAAWDDSASEQDGTLAGQTWQYADAEGSTLAGQTWQYADAEGMPELYDAAAQQAMPDGTIDVPADLQSSTWQDLFELPKFPADTLVGSFFGNDAEQADALSSTTQSTEEQIRNLSTEGTEMATKRAQAAYSVFPAYDEWGDVRGGADDGANFDFMTEDGNVNWAGVVFVVLCLCCGAVWFSLLRSWCAIRRHCLGCPGSSQFIVSDADAKQPLLAPLDREDADVDDFKAMKSSKLAVASDYVPAGAQYVKLEYMPLPSEQQ